MFPVYLPARPGSEDRPCTGTAHAVGCRTRRHESRDSAPRRALVPGCAGRTRSGTPCNAYRSARFRPRRCISCVIAPAALPGRRTGAPEAMRPARRTTSLIVVTAGSQWRDRAPVVLAARRAACSQREEPGALRIPTIGGCARRSRAGSPSDGAVELARAAVRTSMPGSCPCGLADARIIARSTTWTADVRQCYSPPMTWSPYGGAPHTATF
jgi:hypothetical protein